MALDALDLRVENERAWIAAGVPALGAHARAARLDAQRSDEIVTAAGEAVANALEHGDGGAVALRAWREAPEYVVQVDGAGRGVRDAPAAPDLARKVNGDERPRGWGVWLMRSLANAVVFEPRQGGHRVVLRFGAVAPPAPVEIRIDEGGER